MTTLPAIIGEKTSAGLSPFVEAARRFAEHKRRVWSGGLARDIAAIEANEDLAAEERFSQATDKVLAAKKMPPLPAITQEEMLTSLERASLEFGIEPTIEMRAELRAMIANKPPPDMAHRRTLEIFVKHKDMQQLRAISAQITRH